MKKLINSPKALLLVNPYLFGSFFIVALLSTAFLFTFAFTGAVSGLHYITTIIPVYNRVFHLTDDFIYYDETLTMSALAGAYSGDPLWEERYNSFDHELTADIHEIQAYMDDQTDRDLLQHLVDANDALVVMERQSFELTHAGNLVEAQAIFKSAGYLGGKVAYRDGANDLIASMRKKQDILFRSGERVALGILTALLILLPIVCSFWVLVSLLIRKQRHRIEQMNSRLKESEVRLLQAQRTARLGNWEWDIVHGHDYWCVVTYEILGLDPQKTAASYDEFLKTVALSDKRAVVQALDRARKNRQPYDIDFRIIHANGEELVVNAKATVLYDERGEAVKMVGTIQDITERKKLESRLRESEQKYLTLVQRSNDGIIVVQNNIIKFFNTAMLKMLDYRRSEVIGMPFYNFVSAEQRDMAVKTHAARMKGESAKERYNLQIVSKSGTLTPVEINASIIDFEGAPATLAIVRDISKFIELDRLKSEFVATASHQLRTPLTAIKWFIELILKQKNGLKPKLRSYLLQIYSSNERLISTVNDLLTASHIQTGRKFIITKHPELLGTVLKSAISDTIGLAREHAVKIKCIHKNSSKKVVSVDREKIIEAIRNILDNAIKYSKKGSTITLNCSEADGSVIISIKDHGIGIPENQQGHIFEQFFRADNVATQQPGTGLGLYIAKQIIEGHGGRVWFASKVGIGTTFYISLPIT